MQYTTVLLSISILSVRDQKDMYKEWQMPVLGVLLISHRNLHTYVSKLDKQKNSVPPVDSSLWLPEYMSANHISRNHRETESHKTYKSCIA